MVDCPHEVALTPDRPAGGRVAPGFTLVELLVAIWIMALVSVIAWRGLSALVNTRERLGPEADHGVDAADSGSRLVDRYGFAHECVGRGPGRARELEIDVRGIA